MLVSHAAFLAQASTAAAQRLTAEFEKAANSLEFMPQRCPWLTGDYIPRTHTALSYSKSGTCSFPNHGKHGLCRLCGGLSAGLRLAPSQINKKTVASAKLQRVTVFSGQKCLPMGHITCVRGAGSPVDIMCPIQKNGAKHLHSTIYQSHIEQRQTFERSVFQHAVSPKSGLTVLIGTPLRRALSCSYSTRVTSSTKAFSFGVAVDQVTLNRRQT